MNPGLLLPAGLIALAALALPVLIHIARRTETRTVAFAALRWLEIKPSSRRSLQINERLLLASRLLLLALLALWLAQPVLKTFTDDRPVVAVMPGLSADAIAAATQDGDRVVWLSPGFPAVGGPVPARPSQVASLIRQLDAELPPRADLDILVPPILDDMDAERPRLSRRIAWRVVAEENAAPVPDRRAAAPPALAVRHDTDQDGQVRYFRAASASWSTPDRPARFEAAPAEGLAGRGAPGQDARLVWLAAGALPDPILAWVRNGGVILASNETRAPVEGETRVVWRTPEGEPLAISGALGRGMVVRLTRPLTPAALPQLVEADFPDALLSMLAPPQPPSRVLAAQHAPLDGVAPFEPSPLDLRPWLALLIALVFGTERWLATRRKRAVAP